MKATTALALALSALLLTLPASSSAQGMLMSRPAVDASLMVSPVVQKDLAVSDEQKTKLTDLMKKVSENHIEISGGSEEDIKAQLKEYAENNDKLVLKGLNEILDEKQMARFKQINRQAQGVRGFVDKEAKAALSTTEEQSKKLQGIVDGFETEEGELMSTLMHIDGNNQELRIGPEETKKIRALVAKFYEKGLEVLTADQKTKWEELVGTKLDLTGG